MLLGSALAALGLAGALGVPAAHAATPFTAGSGVDPGVAVGSDGTGHVVWATPEPSTVGYCRVSAGADACNRTDALAFGGATNARSTGRPVVFTPAPNKVVVVAGCWNCAGITNRTFVWVSNDNGATFGPGSEIGRRIETHGTGLWIDDGPGTFVGVSGGRAKASALDDFDGVAYATGGLFTYGPSIVRVPGTSKLVAATNDLDTVKYGVYTGGVLAAASINNPTNWLIDRTLSAPEGDNSDTALNAGPNGVHLTYGYFVPNDSRIGLRRFDPAANAFGAPTYVEGTDSIDDHGLGYPTSFQDPSGRIHVVWRSLYDGQRLRYRVSDTAGANFTPAANLALREGFAEPDVAAGSDGKGFAVWTPGPTGDVVRVVALDPQPEPAPPAPPGGGPGGGSGGGTLPVDFTGRGNVLSARIVGKRVRIRARGTIALPSGAPRSACRGKVRLVVKKQRTTLAKRKAKLKRRGGGCRFGKTIFVKRSRVGRATKRLRLKVRFRGNAVLRAGSTTKTLVIRR